MEGCNNWALPPKMMLIYKWWKECVMSYIDIFPISKPNPTGCLGYLLPMEPNKPGSAFFKTMPLLRVVQFFLKIIMFTKKVVCPTKVALLSRQLHIWKWFKNSAIGGLSYGVWESWRGEAVLAPFFFLSVVLVLLNLKWNIFFGVFPLNKHTFSFHLPAYVIGLLHYTRHLLVPFRAEKGNIAW